MVVRANDFRLPKTIADQAFGDVCDAHHIPEARQKPLREFLDELVQDLRGAMTAEKQTPDRAADKDNLSKALQRIQSAKELVRKTGPAGKNACRDAAETVLALVNSAWLREKFPDDSLTPRNLWSLDSPRNRETRQAQSRDPLSAVDAIDRKQRWNFVRNRAGATLIAVLDDVESAIQAAVRKLRLQPGASGGRKPLRHRRDLIINLAESWAWMGRNVTTTQGSNFAAFCELVCEKIGWPTEGLVSAIPGAVRHWRNLPGKIRR